MTLAYVDSSCLVAIAFGERGSAALGRRLEGFDRLVASNLLEAELRGAFERERVPFEADLLSWITWILPDRPLGAEMARALAVGYLRGADLWHLACALYLAEDSSELMFITLDDRQRAVAEALGFRA